MLVHQQKKLLIFILQPLFCIVNFIINNKFILLFIEEEPTYSVKSSFSVHSLVDNEKDSLITRHLRTFYYISVFEIQEFSIQIRSPKRHFCTIFSLCPNMFRIYLYVYIYVSNIVFLLIYHILSFET